MRPNAAVEHELARRVVGCGSLYENDKGCNKTPMVDWRIHRKADVAVLAAFLTQYPLRSKKRHDFALWRKAVEVRATRRKGDGWDEIAQIKAELSASRAYPNEAA